MSGDKLDLDALAALEQAATPSPWVEEHYPGLDPTDAALIAALRNAASALIAAVRDRDRIVGVVSEWMREFGPESRWERSVGPQVVSVGHVYATIVDDDPHPPHSSWPEYAGSLTAVTAERDAARAEVAALRHRVEALADEWSRSGFEMESDQLRAALTTGADQ